MNAITAGNLRMAFGGESMAHTRYGTWARKAEKDGFRNVARLFRAVAFAEEVHAGNHFRELARAGGEFEVLAGADFGIGSTAKNLAGAIGGERFEIDQMYPAYIKAAKLEGERRAAQSMEWALAAEKDHLDLYRRAKRAVDRGRDARLGMIQVCDKCGHTAEGHPPDRCPVCESTRRSFREFA